MAGRTIAIGDIHGCATALRTLLAALELQTDDTLVTLGDVIDRGPDSRDVLDQLMVLRSQCHFVPILGNHEQMMLDAVAGRITLQDWLMHGGAETLDSYAPEAALAEMSERHMEFVRSWKDFHETDGHFFAHGNYSPKRKLTHQPWEELRWISLKQFLPSPHQSGKVAVVGHTANKRGQVVNFGHLVCIDTYCHGGEWLTAFEPATGTIWQANEDGEVQELELPPVT